MDEPVEVAPAPAKVAAAPEVKAPPGALFRQDVNRTVDEGLGYFLQRVSVDADLAEGKFRGFRIVELRPAEYWQGVDLKPGDVVTQVNGMPIERDIDAYQAFQSLRSADALRVTLMRGGVQRDLVYSIVDRDAAQKAGTAPKGPQPATPKKSG
jgi:S1-C subfamily serine protease